MVEPATGVLSSVSATRGSSSSRVSEHCRTRELVPIFMWITPQWGINERTGTQSRRSISGCECSIGPPTLFFWMTIIVTAYAEHPLLALAPTIQTAPDATIQVVAQTGTDPEHDAFPFLVQCSDCDALEQALERDRTVDRFTCIASGDGQRLYHITHTPETRLLTPKTIEVGGIMVEARSENDGWIVKLLLPDRRALDSIWEYAREEDIQFDLIELFEARSGAPSETYDLTDCQLETLVAAYDHGYFSQPRETSLAELAAILSVSPSATSGRLRRGIERLLATTLFVEERHDSTDDRSRSL